MGVFPSKQQRHQEKMHWTRLQRFLLIFIILSLLAITTILLVIGQTWRGPSGNYATPTSIIALSPTLAPTLTPTVVPTATPVPTPTPVPSISLDQRIDRYIDHLTQRQQIGQLLMLAVYANGYTAAFNQPLQQWDIANAIVYNQYNSGPLMPTTLSGFSQMVHALQGHANQPLLIATDEEGGMVDRLAPYYGPSPSPQGLAASGESQQAYIQAQIDALRLRNAGINADFAPLADIYQGGAVAQSRMFGTTPAQVATYAGAFLDGLQQHGVAGTLKHWPGIGSAPANPDYGLPTITHTRAQLNAIDFASFRALLPHHPAMIMVTHAMVPAYDQQAPASLSSILVNQVLRGQLGYQGVVVTDAMDGQGLLQFMQQQGYSDPAQATAEASVRAILAGDDMIECPIEPDRLTATVAAITSAVQSGRISPQRLRQSVHRIIGLKVQMGLIALP
ncbi:MAG TPA: glycoside hydrolase family 3 N-terminal domain-containing protein [Ktedonobacteraceae bacterium]|nr:glycoside hydrolase family 3 N-terminal domain-containing protein [Ktedonobacteraceae bacterium]